MLLTVEGAQVWCHTADHEYDPALPTLVLIHGALNDHRVWDPQSHHFANHGWNILALDLPGHGHSGGTPRISITEMADWLLAVLDEAGVAQAALVGHSKGSLVALEAASRAPQRVTQLGLLGCTYPMQVAQSLLDTAIDDEPKAIAMVAKWSHTPGHPAASHTHQLMSELAGIQPDKLLYTDLAACNDYQHGVAAAQAVRCPTLFIFADGDVMTPPKTATQLVAAIPQASVVTVEGGHAMMAEQPDGVIAALATLIGSR